jgi:hypothetical protein
VARKTKKGKALRRRRCAKPLATVRYKRRVFACCPHGDRVTCTIVRPATRARRAVPKRVRAAGTRRRAAPKRAATAEEREAFLRKFPEDYSPEQAKADMEWMEENARKNPGWYVD